jgi:dihydroxy-acid dehydratase
MSGPALVFEGEEAMITAISENPANFKVPLLYSFF